MLLRPHDVYTREFRNVKFFDSKGNPPRYLGVELEIASMDEKGKTDLAKVVKKWKMVVKDDGSLGEDGFEINTSPARGQSFYKQIHDVCEALKIGEATVDAHCGLHVHVDARDYKVDDLFKALIVWRKIQDDMFNLCKPERKQSQYCRKVRHKFDRYVGWDDLGKFKLNRQIAMISKRLQTINSILGGDRYHAIHFTNMHAGGRGTIENRMHHGSVNEQEILKWALMNVNLFEMVPKLSIEQAKAMNAKQIMEAITP